MEFTQEQIEKARKAKTAEELLTIAKNDGVQITEEEAKKYFDMLNEECEIPEEEIDNVAGGTCYSSGVWGPYGKQQYAIVSPFNSCSFISGFHPCMNCCNSFTCGATWYCAARTKDNDPYKD